MRKLPDVLCCTEMLLVWFDLRDLAIKCERANAHVLL